MSVHTPIRALERVNLPNGPQTILLGHKVGNGEFDDGSLDIIASGDTIRFHVRLETGESYDYELNIQPHADAAVALAHAARDADSKP